MRGGKLVSRIPQFVQTPEAIAARERLRALEQVNQVVQQQVNEANSTANLINKGE
jgi:hypothetical protein